MFRAFQEDKGKHLFTFFYSRVRIKSNSYFCKFYLSMIFFCESSIDTLKDLFKRLERRTKTIQRVHFL